MAKEHRTTIFQGLDLDCGCTSWYIFCYGCSWSLRLPALSPAIGFEAASIISRRTPHSPASRTE